MDRLSEISEATLAALMRDFYLWIGITVLILVFALYVYFAPQSIDFFTNPEHKKKETDNNHIQVRSEPPEDDPHVHA